MPTPTYVALAEVALASSVTSVTFAVPSGYRDITIVANVKNATGVDTLDIFYNGDTTTTNYNTMRVIATSSNTTLAQVFNNSAIGITTTSAFEPNVINILDVNTTDKKKSALSRQSSVANSVGAWSHYWSNTAAITSITIKTSSNYSIVADSTFMMYGIEA